jgi:hypothetical protein
MIAIGFLVSLFWIPLYFYSDDPTRVTLIGMFSPYTLLMPLGLVLKLIANKKATR